jgi:iron complex outermembrane recepter protein
MTILKSHFLLAAYSLFSVIEAHADDQSLDYLSLSLEELVNIQVQVGSRTGDKRLGNHKVPVDIVTADELRRSGYTELPKVLNHLVSSFTYEFSTIDDLTDHVRPFSLNGLKGDQVLVLINGKRVHQSAVIDVNDSQNFGSSSVDLNLIPIEAIQRIEVLRDDASAQYGSDAIAGVINIVLKREQVNETLVTTGQRQAGDGEAVSANYNLGGEKVFISLEYKYKANSNTSGLDRRDYYFPDDSRNGDYRITHIYGDPQAESLSLTFNGQDLFGNNHFYALGKWVYKKSEAAGFFRRPLDDRNIRAIYPDGYLPVLAPKQQDLFTTLGYRDEGEGYSYDLSNTFGYNRMDIDVEHTLNVSLGLDSPTEFDAGQLSFWHNTLNFDATKIFSVNADTPISFAYGGEYRHEEARIAAGEQASWVDGLVPVLDGANAGADTVGGSQLYPGFSPANTNNAERDLAAVYAELSYQMTQQLTTSISLRDEYYSDFGNTINGKFLLNYTPVQKFTVRTSLSTGYRAPSLQQMSYYRTATSFKIEADGSVIGAENGVFPVNNEVARLLGAQELNPEESRRINIGATWQANSALQMNIDFFQINIDDRIILSGDVDNSGKIPVTARNYMTANNIHFARYFHNGVDTSTQGFDTSIKYNTKMYKHELQLVAQMHYQQTDIDALHIPNQLSAIADQVFDRSEQERLKHYLPESKMLFSAKYDLTDWTIFAKANYFGKVLYVDSPSDSTQDQWFDSRITFDADIAYQLRPKMTIAIGGHNIFDVRPETRTSNAPFNGADNIFQFRGISPFDYTGAFYYARVKVGF